MKAKTIFTVGLVAIGISATVLSTNLIVGLNTPVQAQTPARLSDVLVPQQSLAPLVSRVSPAVVNISTRGTVTVERSPFDDFFFGQRGPRQQQRRTGSLGSGVIIDAERGYLLTNNHVVEDADEISVRLVDGRVFDAELVGTDEPTDIAVLKIQASDLTELPIGNSDSISVGDYVLAIGNPFGLEGTVTSGIVSAKGRSGQQAGLGLSYQDFIQTDASINSGNSGGALINLRGELVGINTAIVSRGGGSVGIGFAVPTNMARGVMSQILEFGEVSRGLLGVNGQAMTPRLAERLEVGVDRGALLTFVQPDSGADDAGLKEYDVITGANGRPVQDFDDLRNIVGLVRPGEDVELEVWRDGRKRLVEATIRANPTVETAARSEPVEEKPESMGGATLDDLPDNHFLDDGVLVVDVPIGSEAERSGLRRGDVITEINRTPVRSLDQALDLLNDNEGNNFVKINRNRGWQVLILE